MGRGQGGFAGASPQWAVTAKPTQPSAGYLRNPKQGLKPFIDFCGVARSGETAEGIAQHSRLQKISKCFSAACMGFNQRFLSGDRDEGQNTVFLHLLDGE